MGFVLKGAAVYTGGEFKKLDVYCSEGVIVSLSDSFGKDFPFAPGTDVIDFTGKYIFPGFTDVHVHLREPGFSYKETIFSGSRAAARGGYTTVCAMPNLNPVPDCLESLSVEREIISRDAVINVLPYGAVTVGEKGERLADLDGMAPYVCAFSDDGHGVQRDDMMRSAMEKAKALGKIIAAHCEDNSLLHGGYIHAGRYAAEHGHRGICSESEYGQIKRDIALAAKTGCAYHVCHISTKESAALIRQAKHDGVNISCETAPHYLTLCDDDLQEDGRFKMNPPLRSSEDREALIEALLDGTIDAIATDHAPHSAEEKSRGLEKSSMGITGIETAFPVLYTRLVKTGLVPLEVIISRLTTSPRARFGLGGGEIKAGAPADLTVFDLDEEYILNPGEFISMGKATPFAGDSVFGRCLMTICGGKTAWRA